MKAYNTKFTGKYKKFFNQPRTMQEVTDFFKDDIFEANSFQSVNLIGRNLKTIQQLGKLFFVNYDYVDINEETGRYAAMP